MGPKSSPGGAAVSAASAEESLDAITLKSGVRFSVWALNVRFALPRSNPGGALAAVGVHLLALQKIFRLLQSLPCVTFYAVR